MTKKLVEFYNFFSGKKSSRNSYTESKRIHFIPGGIQTLRLCRLEQNDTKVKASIGTMHLLKFTNMKHTNPTSEALNDAVWFRGLHRIL